MDFKILLIGWYRKFQRDLPWRYTSNPYHIWVSEIILQQTRVAQGLGYFKCFIDAFPTIMDLAKAHEDEVLKVWQGLGYYTRARNLHYAAKFVVDNYNGELPNSYHELLKIRGIGPYSAGAIASFAFKQPVPAIDGNVYRIIARVFGVFASPYTAVGKRYFSQLVTELMDKESPDIFNQALLDFGALQCVPQSPDCSNCPFEQYCYAFRNNMIKSLPVKSKRIIPIDRFFTYLLIRHQSHTFISKRVGKDIWHSLYEFPLIETAELPNSSEIHSIPQWKKIFKGTIPKVLFISPEVKHQLSHQTIYSQFIIVEIDNSTPVLDRQYQKVPINYLDNFSTPKLIDNFLAAEPAEKYFINN
jgi:A/G-specific adenine glycosylase